MSIESQPLLEDKISRLLDDADFRAINARMSKFNLFEAVGAVRGELRRSNFLAYLLSPNRPHGMGSRVLERLIRSVLESGPNKPRPISTLALVVSDLDDAIVHRERDNVDLLVEIPSLKFVVLIENKIDAKAGPGQLRRYKSYLQERYPGHKQLLIFLTPHGAKPDDDEYWAYSYGQVARVLEGSLAEFPTGFGLEVELIVRHYVEMLRRHIVEDDQLKNFAVRLYERHKEALDFILENRPRVDTLLSVIMGAVSGSGSFSIDSTSANAFRFAPNEWEKLSALASDPKIWTWTKSGRSIMFEVKVYPANPGRVNIALIVGPGPAEIRKAVYESAVARPKTFTGLVKPMGVKWSSIFSRELQTAEAANGIADDAQSENLTAAWEDFKENRLPELIKAVMEIDDQFPQNFHTDE